MKKSLLKLSLFALLISVAFAFSYDKSLSNSSNVFTEYNIGIYDNEKNFIRINEETMSKYWASKIDAAHLTLDMTNFKIVEEVDKETKNTYPVLRAQSTDGKINVATVLERKGDKLIFNEVSCSCISQGAACEVLIINSQGTVGCSCEPAKKNSTCTKQSFVTSGGWEDFQ